MKEMLELDGGTSQENPEEISQGRGGFRGEGDPTRSEKEVGVGGRRRLKEAGRGGQRRSKKEFGGLGEGDRRSER